MNVREICGMQPETAGHTVRLCRQFPTFFDCAIVDYKCREPRRRICAIDETRRYERNAQPVSRHHPTWCPHNRAHHAYVMLLSVACLPIGNG